MLVSLLDQVGERGGQSDSGKQAEAVGGAMDRRAKLEMMKRSVCSLYLP